ncbi:S8 family peptidase [Niabella terrae]
MNSMFRKAGTFAAAIITTISVSAQMEVPNGWYLKDLQKDGLYGISLDQAYDFVKSKNLKSTPVIVGIVDSGIDTTHEDLKPVLWVNKKEVAGNGKDDDKNGYVDDTHGWNFLGNKDGGNVEKDSYEAARFYWNYKDEFDGKSATEIAADRQADYKTWLRAKEEINKDADPQQTQMMLKMAKVLLQGDSIVRADLKKEEYNGTDLKTYNPSSLNVAATQMKTVLLRVCEANQNDDITNKMLIEEIQKDIDKAKLTVEAPENYRDEVVKDNYQDFKDKYYGNSNLYVTNESAFHGTHVAGIIGAARGNGIGIDGIADNVRIMSIRAVPDGDEHDKDIALAIRYAVDNGARVINMSFGKGFSPEKQWVDEAVKYAADKNVLLVHAAGNDNSNIDTAFNFPTAHFLDGSRPDNWITVGASGDEKLGGLTASFSNYGKKEVDVFAPGVKIYSTIPGGNKYGNAQGTSMASPVVAGIAAFIMSYYPDLTAAQVKQIIEQSVSKPTEKVSNPGGGDDVMLSDISVTGGIVNAYNAIQLADKTSKEKPKRKKK